MNQNKMLTYKYNIEAIFRSIYECIEPSECVILKYFKQQFFNAEAIMNLSILTDLACQ